MFDATIIIELVIVIISFFAYKYGVPFVKDILMSRWAYIVVAAANEMHLVDELEDKWSYAMQAMKNKLEKYKITFDEVEVTNYLKAAVTKLRTEIDKTDAQKIKEQG